MGAIFFSYVVAIYARKRRGIRPDVVRMVNDTDILVVNRVGATLFKLFFNL